MVQLKNQKTATDVSSSNNKIATQTTKPSLHSQSNQSGVNKLEEQMPTQIQTGEDASL